MAVERISSFSTPGSLSHFWFLPFDFPYTLCTWAAYWRRKEEPVLHVSKRDDFTSNTKSMPQKSKKGERKSCRREKKGEMEGEKKKRQSEINSMGNSGHDTGLKEDWQMGKPTEMLKSAWEGGPSDPVTGQVWILGSPRACAYLPPGTNGNFLGAPHSYRPQEKAAG